MSMSTLRGASELVGNVIMLLIVTALISQAFLYGMPLLKKRMDEAATTYMENALKELADAIEVTALQGGETRVRIEAKSRFSSPPIIKLTKDQTGEYMIELRAATQVAKYASKDIPLNDFTSPYNESSVGARALGKMEGVLGINKPVVVTGSCIQLRGGIRLVMKVVPRPIRDPSRNVLTVIELQPITGKSTKANLPVVVDVKKIAERNEVERVETPSGTAFVTKRIITVGVGFE